MKTHRIKNVTKRHIQPELFLYHSSFFPIIVVVFTILYYTQSY